MLHVHKVRQQINGPHDAPYAQRLDLGWVIGEVCLGNMHKASRANAYKANVLSNGRTSLMKPYPNTITVKENMKMDENADFLTTNIKRPEEEQLGSSLFVKTKIDEKLALPFEDQIFLDIMDKQMYQDESKSWVAPLPFRSERHRLPNNREQILKRLRSLCKSLEKIKLRKNNLLNSFNGHAELDPPVNEKGNAGTFQCLEYTILRKLTRSVSYLIRRQNLMVCH